jgi:hypothetical protein
MLHWHLPPWGVAVFAGPMVVAAGVDWDTRPRFLSLSYSVDWVLPIPSLTRTIARRTT